MLAGLFILITTGFSGNIIGHWLLHNGAGQGAKDLVGDERAPFPAQSIRRVNPH